MAKKLLLCASTFHISAALWSGRQLVGCRGFEDDDAGHAAFQSLLNSTAGVPVYAQETTRIPDLSWGYVRIDPAGSGSFDGLTADFEPVLSSLYVFQVYATEGWCNF